MTTRNLERARDETTHQRRSRRARRHPAGGGHRIGIPADISTDDEIEPVRRRGRKRKDDARHGDRHVAADCHHAGRAGDRQQQCDSCSLGDLLSAPGEFDRGNDGGVCVEQQNAGSGGAVSK